MTCMLLILLMAYSEKKIVNFLLRSSPNINVIDVPDNFDANYAFDFDGVGLKLAFSVEQFNSPFQARDDPSYVSWNVRLKSSLNGVVTIRNLTNHKCTDADYDSFNPPKASVIIAFKAA